MNILVGIQHIHSNKNNKDYKVLHMLDEHIVSNDKQDGQLVSTEFVEMNDSLEIQGDMKLGSYVRVFKENINGLDKVSLLSFTPRQKK